MRWTSESASRDNSSETGEATNTGTSDGLSADATKFEKHVSPSGDLASSRRHDLDWLRVLVILFVFVYHVALAFDGRYYVPNDRIASLVHQFLTMTWFLRMPVLFFIAGAAAWFVFRRRTPRNYMLDRFRRLGIPFVCGFVALLPLQALFVRRHEFGEFPSALAAWTDFMRTSLPAINQHWSYLWFIAYLILASVVCLPALLYFRTEPGGRFLHSFQRTASTMWGLALLAVPLIAIEWGMRWRWSRTNDLLNDWTSVALLIVLFLYGYMLFGSDDFWIAIDRYKFLALGGGVGTMGLMFVSWLILGSPAETPWQHPFSLSYTAVKTIVAVNGWFWLLAAIGYARHFLSFENRLLRYARDASYPFYLLHQPILVAVGVYVIAMPINPALKFVVICVVSLILTVVVYDLCVRRWNAMRFAFGLRTSPSRVSQHAPPEPASTGVPERSSPHFRTGQ